MKKIADKTTAEKEVIVNNELNNNGMKTQSEGLQLNYQIRHGMRNRARQNNNVTPRSNQPAFERFSRLCLAQYYFRIYPYKHQNTGECYFWIFGVKKSSQVFDLKLKVNEEILNVVMGYLSTGELINTTNIDADNINEFSQNVTNFSLSLFQAEVMQGQKKVRHVGNKTYSKYDYGMIIYNTNKNGEMKEFINSTIL